MIQYLKYLNKHVGYEVRGRKVRGRKERSIEKMLKKINNTLRVLGMATALTAVTYYVVNKFGLDDEEVKESIEEGEVVSSEFDDRW